MDLDEQFEPVSDAVALPDKLLASTMQHLAGLKRVDIERKQGKNSWHKVNGFTVEHDTLGKAKDPPERISTMIVAVAMTDVETNGADGVYRAKYWKDEDGEEKRRTFSFKQRLGEDGVEAVHNPEDEGDALMLFGQAMSQVLAFVQIQNAHVENQNARILSQSEMATSQIKQLLDTHETLINKYHEGLTMQANALTLMLDVERNLESDKQKGKNTEKLLGMMDKALPAALTQFSKYISKTGGGEDEDEDEEEDGGEDNSAVDTGGGKVVQLKQDPEKAALEKQMKEKPLTTFAHAFKDSLSSDQLMDLTDALTKKQSRAFREATSKETDDSTADAILKFRDAMFKTPAVLGKVQEILSEKQFQMIMRLNELAADREGGDGD